MLELHENITLGKRLKQLRGKRTQSEIARIVGVLRASYCHYENDHVEPSLKTLCRIADTFGVSVDFLLGREDKTMEGFSNIMVNMIEEVDRKLYETILELKKYKSLESGE